MENFNEAFTSSECISGPYYVPREMQKPKGKAPNRPVAGCPRMYAKYEQVLGNRSCGARRRINSCRPNLAAHAFIHFTARTLRWHCSNGGSRTKQKKNDKGPLRTFSERNTAFSPPRVIVYDCSLSVLKNLTGRRSRPKVQRRGCTPPPRTATSCSVVSALGAKEATASPATFNDHRGPSNFRRHSSTPRFPDER